MNTEHYKKLLEEEKMKLEGELGGIGRKDETTGEWESIPGEENERADINEQGDRNEEYNERSAIAGTLEKRLAEVTVALGKIANHSYGLCEACGNKIEEARLEANPAATTCIACKD